MQSSQKPHKNGCEMGVAEIRMIICYVYFKFQCIFHIVFPSKKCITTDSNCSEFLLSVSLVYLTGVASGQDVIIEMELIALGRRNRTNYNKNKKVVRKKIVEHPESELSQLQHEIISFLGRLDNTTCLALLKDPQQEENIIPWATCLQQPLVFPLPFKDMKLNISLGLWVIFM
jgi:hypothetical protein